MFVHKKHSILSKRSFEPYKHTRNRLPSYPHIHPSARKNSNQKSSLIYITAKLYLSDVCRLYRQWIYVCLYALCRYCMSWLKFILTQRRNLFSLRFFPPANSQSIFSFQHQHQQHPKKRWRWQKPLTSRLRIETPIPTPMRRNFQCLPNGNYANIDVNRFLFEKDRERTLVKFIDGNDDGDGGFTHCLSTCYVLKRAHNHESSLVRSNREKKMVFVSPSLYRCS